MDSWDEQGDFLLFSLLLKVVFLNNSRFGKY